MLGGGEEVGLGVRLHLLVAGHRALLVVVREHLGSSGPGARGHTHLGYTDIGIYVVCTMSVSAVLADEMQSDRFMRSFAQL